MKFQSKYICVLLIIFCSSATLFAQKGKSKPKSSKYDYQGAYFEGIARVKLDHKWGFIDTTGNVIIAPKYNEVTNFSGGIAKVRIGQRWGLVDSKGAVIIKPTFVAIFDFENGKAKVLLEGEEYYINKEGNRVD